MASLYKKPVVLTDPKTGARVKTKSKKWWGRFRDESGVEKRVPLAADKTAAQAMLNELVKKMERRAAGLSDPTEDQRKRPLAEHVEEWQKYLLNKNNTEKHVGELVYKVRRIAKACAWQKITDIAAGQVVQCLADLRKQGLSIQTSNHHLRAVKQFGRWLVRDRRTHDDPLAHISMQNPRLDCRHRRRALLPDEFRRLAAAANVGRAVESIGGPDRSMMYVLAAWTGFRKGEIGSLTLESFRLDSDPPTAIVAAAYSKRRREDSQILHPEVAEQLRQWILEKRPKPGQILFPVSGKVPGGIERKTNLMMKKDLESARRAWIDEAESSAEADRRRESDFLRYENSLGEFADFHSNRHLFITSLERAGLSPKMAQTLARHSDIRLTLGVYTHVGVHDQTAAIGSLPSPPREENDPKRVASRLAVTGTDGIALPRLATHDGTEKVPTVVPSGAESGAILLASKRHDSASSCTEEGAWTAATSGQENGVNSDPDAGNRTKKARMAPVMTGRFGLSLEAHPAGVEPATFGSVDRCSIH
jgi:site-specific recombinase XerD